MCNKYTCISITIHFFIINITLKINNRFDILDITATLLGENNTHTAQFLKFTQSLNYHSQLDVSVCNKKKHALIRSIVIIIEEKTNSCTTSTQK